MLHNTALRRFTEEEVSKIFTDPGSEAARRWIEYWSSTESRNEQLLAQFRAVVSLGFKGRMVLDAGCGTAGLATQVAAEGGSYIGVDYSSYILKMGQYWLHQKVSDTNGAASVLIRASGLELPFHDESFDYIFAFDVIEHLGNPREQLKFLIELRRLLRPMGMIFLTTPNRWYPFEGHTFLYFPQYLPTRIADRYISKRNPGFLDEHGSFASITLLTPAEFRRLLRLSQLSLLHELPCCMDYEDLPVLKRASYRTLGALRLSWHPLQEFWGCLVRTEARRPLLVKCIKHHRIALNESEQAAEDFCSMIDFSSGARAHQLKSGWFPYEKTEQGFRWMTEQAEAWLQAEGGEEFLLVEGHCRASGRSGVVTLDVYCDNCWIGRHRIAEEETFRLRFLLPSRLDRLQICTAQLRAHPHFTPAGADRRRLGAAISRLGLAMPFERKIDFNREQETPGLERGWYPREQDRRGYRWIAEEAEIWLRVRGEANTLFVSGYCNASDRSSPVEMTVYCDDQKIGARRINQNEMFDLYLPLPPYLRHLTVCNVRFAVDPCYLPGGVDRRKLGLSIFQIAIL